MNTKRLLEMVNCVGPKTPTDRLSIFTFLQYNDYPTPDYGRVKDLCGRHDPLQYLMVYPQSGRGLILRLVEAERRYPDAIASVFLGDLVSPYLITRQVQIGDRTYWCDYTCQVWGKSTGKVVRFLAGYQKIEAPLFSIDLIKKGDTTFAIDFDIIPPLRNSGLKDILSPKEVRKLIRKTEKK